MQTTRLQQLEQALRQNYPHHRRATYILIARLLLYAESERANGHNWVSTYNYRMHGHDRRTLDKAYRDGLLLKMPPPTTMLWKERGPNHHLYDPTGKEQAILHELNILLRHAQGTTRVREIVAAALGVDPTTSIPNIRAEFLSRNPSDRVTTYNAILDQIEAEGLRDPNFDYMRLQYMSMNNKWSLHKRALSMLSAIH